jgi:hypothetical protein
MYRHFARVGVGLFAVLAATLLNSGIASADIPIASETVAVPGVPVPADLNVSAQPDASNPDQTDILITLNGTPLVAPVSFNQGGLLSGTGTVIDVGPTQPTQNTVTVWIAQSVQQCGLTVGSTCVLPISLQNLSSNILMVQVCFAVPEGPQGCRVEAVPL